LENKDEINYPVKFDIEEYDNQGNIINPIPVQDDENFKKILYKIRIMFLRKTYAITTCQLFFAIGVSFLSYIDPIKLFFENNFIALIISIVFIIFILCFVFIKKSIAKKVPNNYIIVFFFTIFASIICLFLSCTVTPIKIIVAWSKITLMVFCIIAFLFIFKSKFYVIWAIVMLFIVSCVYLIIIIMFSQIIFEEKLKATIFFLVLSTLGELLFGIYLIYYSQMLINKNVEIETDTYVIHSIQIYSDIILMFMNLFCNLAN